MSNRPSSNRYTLICPTVDRHDYLQRSIYYWSKLPYRVIYIDGSLKEFEYSQNCRDNIKYIHMPGATYSERVLCSLDYLDTDYASMVCDDEYYLPKAIDMCIKFLDCNSDYNSAMGYPLGFCRPKADTRDFSFKCIYPNLMDRCLSLPTPIGRLQSHFRLYSQCHLYSIIRSEPFYKNMRFTQILQKDIDLWALGELTFEFLMSASGKTMILPYLYWLRSMDVAPTANWQYGNGEFEKPIKFSQWWKSSKVNVGCTPIEFCRKLEASDTNSLNAQEIQKIFDVYYKFLHEIYPNAIHIKISSEMSLKMIASKGIYYDQDEFNSFKKSVLSNID